MIDSSQIGDNDPVPLETAVRVFLPHAGITLHTLRAEISRGRLACMRVGRVILVTRQQVTDMLERCQQQARTEAPRHQRERVEKRSERAIAANENLQKSLEALKVSWKKPKTLPAAK